MRYALVVLVVVAACKSKPSEKAAPATPKLAVPTVSAATVLAADDTPPLLAILDDATPPTPNENIGRMKVRAAYAKTWADLAKSNPAKQAKELELGLVYRYAREGRLLEQPVERVFANLPMPDDIMLDLESLEDTTTHTGQDDPPPPEEEDKPDDGEDESGGTGTAMALEEGKMGKKDSERAEGQYRMQKNVPDEQLAKKPVEVGQRGPIGRSFASLAAEEGDPTRLADVAGEFVPDGKLRPQHLALLVSPRTNAQRLALVIAESLGAAIVVSHGTTVRPLRLDFSNYRDSTVPFPEGWIEARVSKTGLVVEAVPDKPIDVKELTQLADALAKARASRSLDPNAPVDVLVDADIDAQRLIDVLVALDQAKARIVGIGAAPDAEQLKRRGKRNPTVVIGSPNVVGDIEQKDVQRVFKANRDKLVACYKTALGADPELDGAIEVVLLIENGKVKEAALSLARKVDAELSKCLTTAAQSLAFPAVAQPVQVNLPLTLRP